ncbi:MAG TPA: hypothetical protein VJ456_10180 [Acidimicrobiia bacterium]|nr:hypothetical protein [Acidimicrobiia bacterium]
MPASRLLSRLAVAACIVASGLMAVASPASATAEDPLLWSGTVRTLTGVAAGANVVAYARPPARLLGVDGPALVPLGHATTDAKGRFALRTVPTAAMTALADDAGWISVMVAAVTPEGVALAVDSVAWDATGRRWVSDPAERFGGERHAASGEAPSSERPAELIIPTVAAPTTIRAAEGHSPDPGWCVGPLKSEDAGRSGVGVGEMHLNRNWGGYYNYTNTKTTSFQIGVSQDGAHWSVGGSSTMSHQSASGQEVTFAPDPREHLYTWKAIMIFKRFSWRCGMPGNWKEMQTLEPVDWTGFMDRPEGGAPPACDPQYRGPIPGLQKFNRSSGSSQTLDGAISLLGFSGSTTATTSESVQYQWYNAVPRPRDLCGSRQFLTRNTRIYSFA